MIIILQIYFVNIKNDVKFYFFEFKESILFSKINLMSEGKSFTGLFDNLLKFMPDRIFGIKFSLLRFNFLNLFSVLPIIFRLSTNLKSSKIFVVFVKLNNISYLFF